jgi:predicted dehydrogenase
MQRIRDLITRGELGKIYAVDLVFHNAYGPDKPWFYNSALSGGGCLLDLGVHLIDLAFWTLGRCEIEEVQSALVANGEPFRKGSVEDYASAQIKVRGGPVIRLVCSWRAPAGCDAEIGATFFGTNGGARLFNLDHSFYRFGAEHLLKERRRVALGVPEEEWGGGAISDWAEKIAVSPEFDVEAEEYETTAEVLDRIYGDRG